MTTLLILHDSPDFGGHERMLLALLPGVTEARAFDRIVFCLSEVNERLRATLQAFSPRIEVRTWRFVKQRSEPYRRYLRWRFRAAVRRLVAALRPAVVLLIQGRIENLATALAAIPRGVPMVSYLPMAHRMTEMGRSALGDRVRRALYRRPDAFIVPAGSVAAQVARAGGSAPVTVAPNVVAPPPRTDAAEARRALGLPATGRIALFLGRLEHRQKGLDLLVAAIARIAPNDDWTYVFVGDGPDRALIDTARADVRLVPWTDRPDLFLSAADVLLMPSRWEGLPLVMLEAMAYRVPILASPIDIFREYLPATHLVDFATIGLPTALARVADDEASAAPPIGAQSLAASRAAFAGAIEAQLP